MSSVSNPKDEGDTADAQVDVEIDVALDAVAEPLATDAPEAPRAEADAWLREAELAPPELAARLLHHAGWLLERAGDRERAGALYERVRALAPDYRPALWSVLRVRADAGDWLGVGEAYAAELAWAKTPAEKFELLRARANVLARRAGRADLAAAVAQEALAISPEHPAVLAWAIDAAVASGDAGRATELFRRRAAGVRDDRMKGHFLGHATRWALTAGDDALAGKIREEQLAVDPLDLEAQAAVLPDAYARDDLATLERVLRAEVDSSSGSTTRVRLARFLLERRDAIEDALELLQQAREINPRDALALEALVAAQERKGDAAALEAQLAIRADTARDPLDKAVAALRLARLAEAAGRADDAKVRFTQVLEHAPAHPEARAALVRLGAAPAVDEAVEELRERIAAAASAREKADALFLLGAHLARIGQPAAALERWTEALATDPTHLSSRNAIVRAHEAASRIEELVAFLENEAAAASDDDRRWLALSELATSFDTREDPRAAATYRRALELRSDTALATALARLAGKAGDAAGYAFALTHAARPGAARPVAAQVTLLERAAHAIEPFDATAAVDLHRRVLAIDEAHLASLEALRALFTKTGDTEALASIPPRSGADAGARRRAIGEANEALRSALVAGDRDATDAALRRVVDAMPQHPTAWAELARVTEEHGDFATAAAALAHHASLLTDGMAKADARYRVAELASQRLGDAARAESACEEAVLAFPRHGAAWRLLARLALARGDLARSIAALEQEIAVTQLKDRTLAQRRLARLLADRAGARDRAIAMLREIVDSDPSDLDAMSDLERLLREAGDLLRSAELRGKLASRCADMRAAAALRTSAAEDRARAGDEEGAVNEYRRALALDARNRAAADEVMLAMRAKGDRAGLADVYQRVAPYFDNDTQAVLLLLRGELYEADGQLQLAVRAFRDAVAADPLLLPALRDARRLHERAGEWNEARALLAAEGEAVPGADESITLVVRAGEIAERLRELEQAEAHYLRALEKRPAEPRALERLDALLRPQGRFGELVTILEREGESQGVEPARAAELYAEAAWLRYEKLGEDRRAAVPLNRALARNPRSLRALELKAVLATAEGRSQEAQEALNAALEAAGPAERARLHARLAEAHLAGGRAADALECAQAASDAEPSSLKYLELVAEAALKANAFLVALASAEKLLSLATDRVNAAKYAKFAGSVRRLAGDVEGASGLYRRALELLPGDREAIEGLEGAHFDARDFAGLASAYEALAASTAGDHAAALGYLAKAATLWEQAQAPMRAAGVYRNALQTDPGNATLRLALARTLGTMPTMRTDAAAELRSLVAHDARVPDPYRELAGVFEAEGRADAAFVARACLVALGAATPEELARYGERAARLPPGPAAAPSPDELELLVHPAERASPVRDVFAALSDALPKVLVGNLEARGIGRGHRLGGDLRAVADRLARVYGVGEFELAQSTREPAIAWVENTVPPTLVLGAQRLQGGVGELLFTLGMLFGRVRQRTHAAQFAQPIEIANLVAEALRQADPAFARFGTRTEELAKAMARAVGRSERKALEAVLPRFAGPVNFGAYTQAMAFTSHRFGLATAGDPAAAVAVLAHDPSRAAVPPLERPEVKELLAFAVSEEHLALRQKLKIAVG